MKKNKTFIVMTLLIAIVALGIGYAVITGIDLVINGSASSTTSDNNFKVEFEGVPTVEKLNAANEDLTGEQYIATAAINETAGAKLAANFSLSGFDTKGQKAVFTYDIRNKSTDIDATVAVGTIINTNSNYFRVTAVLSNSTITAEDKQTVTVTVELIKTPVESDETATITVPITATAKTPTE